MLNWLRRRSKTGRTASEIYGSIVTQARVPAFYESLGVADTMEGRFGVLLVHLFAVARRLATEGDAGRELSRAVIEAFVTDMDDNMREIGVGDLSVPRKVKKAAAALYDWGSDFEEALASTDRSRLAAALARRVGGREDWPGAEQLAVYVRDMVAALDKAPGPELLAGQLAFVPLEGMVDG